MRLFHGTNVDFDRIDLRKCRPSKDFGRGFYLTDIKRQAEEMAVRRCEIEKKGTPVVQEYEFDPKWLDSTDLKCKDFPVVSEEWARFIMMNRRSRGQKVHDFDIVSGPVADDNIVMQFNLFAQKIIDMPTLIRELTYRKWNHQYYFGTELAIGKLQRIWP